MAKKGTRKAAKPKTLKTKSLRSDDAQRIRGGAYQAHISIKGK